MKNILVYGLEFIGDSLFTTPFLRELRQLFPDSQITVLTGKRGAAVVLKNNPNINKIIELDKDFKIRKKFIRDSVFDTAFVLNTSLSAALETRFGKVKKIYGQRKEGRGVLLTRSIRFDKNRHYADNHLLLLEKLFGVIPVFSLPEIFPDDNDKAAAISLLKQKVPEKGKGLVCLIPGTTNVSKAWSTENFSFLAAELNKYGFTCIAVGSGQDKELCSGITNSINIAGLTTIHQLYHVFQECTAVVSGDTGPLHIAGCVKEKQPHITALYGPTDPLLYGVYHYPKVKVIRKPCRLLSEISVSEVLASVIGNV